MPNIIPSSSDPDRQKKIIVALFLILGKALHQLPAHKRQIQVTEEEIRKAWVEQRSPVRLVSRVEEYFALGGNQRIFQTMLQDLDLQKTGMFSPGEKYPEFKEPAAEDSHHDQKAKRVFDFD